LNLAIKPRKKQNQFNFTKGLVKPVSFVILYYHPSLDAGWESSQRHPQILQKTPVTPCPDTGSLHLTAKNHPATALSFRGAPAGCDSVFFYLFRCLKPAPDFFLLKKRKENKEAKKRRWKAFALPAGLLFL